MKRLLALSVVAAAASACGGSGTTTYTSVASSRCLVQQGVTVSHKVDFVASTALGGSFRATLSDNFVTVSFGRTSGDADNIADAYRRFKSANVGIEDVLREQGNAVMLWHEHPSDTDLSIVTGCLKA